LHRSHRCGHITVYSGAEEFSENRIKFNDGKEADFDAVVLATGYRPQVCCAKSPWRQGKSAQQLLKNNHIK